MSYLFSFNVAPPTGFSINGQTGLITIAATAAPFSGNLSVKVFDGVTTDIKAIPIVLSAPTISPLLSSSSLVSHRGGGRTVAIGVLFDPVVYRGGGRITFAALAVLDFAMTSRGGQSRTATLVETAAETPNTIRVQINQAVGVLAIGNSAQLTATVIAENCDGSGECNPVTANQSVTWSIESGGIYGTISSTGIITATDGSFAVSELVFVVKATSVAYPTFSKTENVSAIAKFTGIQVTPSQMNVQPGNVISINSLLLGQIGPGRNLNGAHASNITVAVTIGASTTFRTGNNISYTVGAGAGPIVFASSYYYPDGNYTVTGSATVQNSG